MSDYGGDAQMNAIRQQYLASQLGGQGFGLGNLYGFGSGPLGSSLLGNFGGCGSFAPLQPTTTKPPKAPAARIGKVTAKPGYIIRHQYIAFGEVVDCIVEAKKISDYKWWERVLIWWNKPIGAGHE